MKILEILKHLTVKRQANDKGRAKNHCHQHGFVASGADGINLNFGNSFVLLFRLTETF